MPGTALPALEELALGIEADGLGEALGDALGVPAPDVALLAAEPDEPALVLPLALGTRLTSLPPGAGIAEPPTEAPGVLPVVVPLPAAVPALPAT